MRISDWSSDVCSSDLWVDANVHLATGPIAVPPPILGGSSDPLLEWASRESGSGLATLFEGSTTGIRRFSDAQAVAVGLHLKDSGKIGRAHVWTPVTNAQLVCRLLLEK